MTYRLLFPLTPRFKYRADLPVTGLILLVTHNSEVEMIAANYGILVDVFLPPFLKEYLTEERRRAL